MSNHTAVANAMTESELQENVRETCEALGLLYWHDNDSRRNYAGFPDTVIVGTSVLWAELKRQRGSNLRPAQVVWRDRLLAAGEQYRLWRPTDWLTGAIARDLTALRRVARPPYAPAVTR